VTAPQDIEPAGFPSLSWTAQDTNASLDALAEWVEAQAAAAIAWYLREKRPKAAWSRFLRIAAITFATIGAAVPFVTALIDDLALEWGYLAFALAGAAMAFDRFFGLSSAWMRYLLAEMALQRILQDMRLQRTALHAARAGRAASAAEIQAELRLLATAAHAVHAEVERETIAWVSEFQSNVAELSALARTPKGRGGSAAE
jgi:hypothetical protein